jgi:hypothetical protein
LLRKHQGGRGKETINDSWSATFRFVDCSLAVKQHVPSLFPFGEREGNPAPLFGRRGRECVILVNSQRTVEAALKGINYFLNVRGLQVNENKTKIIDLSNEMEAVTRLISH